jgi:glycosyltransferase 2 family protein
MQRSTLKKVGKRVLQIGLPLVILAIFSYSVQRNWNQLTAYKFDWNPWLLALSFLGFFLQELSYGLIWRKVLMRLGAQLDLRAALRIYLASEFVRYIPGNVWHVLTRIIWVGKYGVSRSVALASMTVELITKLAAGVLIFALSLLFWSDIGAVQKLVHGTPIVVGLGVALILGLLIGLHPRVLNGLLNGALRVLKRDPVVLTLRYGDILLVTFYWLVSWSIAGIAFYVLLLSLLPTVPVSILPICIGIYAIAWDIGFVSFITPSGLGFREGAIVGIFALAVPFLPTTVAGILALLSRLVSTIAELICVSIAYVSGGKQVRAVQLEQTEQTSVADGETKQDDVTDHEVGESSRVSVEGGVGND